MSTDFCETLRVWRRTRRFSQLDLALEAGVSPRHLSFLETGRAQPSREMVLRLAEALEMPLEARNGMLLSARYAPAYSQRDLSEESLAPVRRAIERMMRAHDPAPAVVLDRTWTLVDANLSARALFEDDGDALIGANLVDLMLAPDGARTRILNFGEVAGAFALRLRAEARAQGGEPRLLGLAERVEADPETKALTPLESDAPFIPLRVQLGPHVLSFFTLIAQFGSVRDVTLGDLRMELFFPADAPTEAVLAHAAASLDT